MFDATSPSRLPRLVKLFMHAFGFEFDILFVVLFHIYS